MEDFKMRFNALLIDKLKVSEEELKPETKFTDLGADSLDMAELIIDLEATFNITISDEDAERITTIKDAEEYLKNKMSLR